MPAKKVAKKTAAKKSAKKPAPKKSTPAKAPSKKAVPKAKAKPAPKPAAKPEPKPISQPVVKPTPPPVAEHDDFEFDGPTKECEHCDGIGKCTSGEPYDKGHHQMFGAKLMLTSCAICLDAAGEHANSKKLVACSFCKGTGRVKS